MVSATRALLFLAALACASQAMAKTDHWMKCGSVETTASWEGGVCAIVTVTNPAKAASVTWAAHLSVAGLSLTTGPSGIGNVEALDKDSYLITPVGPQGAIGARSDLSLSLCGTTDAIDEAVVSFAAVFSYSANYTLADAEARATSASCPFLPISGGTPSPAPAPEESY